MEQSIEQCRPGKRRDWEALGRRHDTGAGLKSVAGGSPGQALFDLDAARSESTSRAHNRNFWVTSGQPGQVRCDLVCALVARGARAGNRSAPLGLESHPRAIEIGPNQAGQDSNVEPEFSVTPMLPLQEAVLLAWAR